MMCLSKWIRATLAIALLAGTATTASALSDPIPGIDIIVRKNPGSLIVGMGTTGKDGKFAIENLEPGTYELDVLPLAKATFDSSRSIIRNQGSVVKDGVEKHQVNITFGTGKDTKPHTSVPFEIAAKRGTISGIISHDDGTKKSEPLGDELKVGESNNGPAGKAPAISVPDPTAGTAPSTTISNASVAENNSPRPQDRKAVGSPTGTLDPASTISGAPNPSSGAENTVVPKVDPNAWRFTQKNGEWWHYGTDNQWMVHRNGKWVTAGDVNGDGTPDARKVTADTLLTLPDARVGAPAAPGQGNPMPNTGAGVSPSPTGIQQAIGDGGVYLDVTGKKIQGNAATTPPDPNAWRYKQQNGEWWYFGTDEKWLVHRNGQWIPYVAPTGSQAVVGDFNGDGIPDNVARPGDQLDRPILRGVIPGLVLPGAGPGTPGATSPRTGSPIGGFLPGRGAPAGPSGGTFGGKR